MTCIVGYVARNGVVYLGADSASSDGHRVNATKTPKLARLSVGGQTLVLGFTSSWRMGQILQRLELPEFRDEDPLEYVITRLIPLAREALKTHGFAVVQYGSETGGTWLVGLSGRLFQVQSDYSVLERSDPYDACGSGEDYALGALWALTRGRRHPSPVRLLETALEAAETHVTTVGSPFQFVDTSQEPG